MQTSTQREIDSRALIIAYVREAPINEALKQELLQSIFENKIAIKQQFNFPEIFFEAFQNNIPAEGNAERIIKRVSLAGYLMYSSIIAYDSKIDKISNINENINYDFNITVLHEECVLILSKIFEYGSPFWIAWNKNRFDLHRSVIRDVKFKKSLKYVLDFSYSDPSRTDDVPIAKYFDDLPHVSSRDYIRLVTGKSAVGRSAIDAAYYISASSNKNLYNRLIRSYNLFMIAVAILDDISDIREDIIHPQINATHLLVAKLLKENNEKKHFIIQNINDLKYYFYSTSCSHLLFNFIFTCLDKAIEVLGEYNPTLWIAVINRFQLGAVHMFDAINS